MEVFSREDRPFPNREDAEKWLAQPGNRGLIAKDVREMARATGFSDDEIQAYILTDATPYLSAIEVKLYRFVHNPPTGGTIVCTQPTIETSGNTSYEQRRAACRELGKALTLLNVKDLTESDRHLWELLRQVGEPPSKGSKGQKTYWERLRQMWNADKRYRR